MKTKKSYFYDYTKVFSYNKNNIVIVGDRGHGKSYGIKDIGLKYSIKIKQLGLIWIRRYDIDLKKLKKRFLTDWLMNNADILEKYDIYSEGDFIYAQDKKTMERFEICEFIALNTYDKQKSIPRPYVKYVVYDEFITTGQYLNDECFAMSDIKESIIRTREQYFFIFLANALSTNNPILEGFGITPKDFQREFTTRFNFVLHYDNFDSEWKEYKRSVTKPMFTNYNYEEYSMESRFIMDDDAGVEEPPKNAIKKFRFNLSVNGNQMGVWDVNGLYFISEPVKGTGARTYTNMSNECFSENFVYMSLKDAFWKGLLEAYLSGMVRFKSLKIKNEIMNVFKLASNTFK